MPYKRSFSVYLIFSIIAYTMVSCTGTSKVQNKDVDKINSARKESRTTFRIVGYYSLDEALKADPDTVPFDRLTHINLWFLNPDSLGNYTRDLTSLSAFIDEAHQQNVKVLFSIGGGGNYPHYEHLLTDGHRSRLIKNLVNEVLKYKVDGVDVDLEGNAINKNYEPFVVELGKTLRQYNKLMTSAIAVYYKDQLTDLALQQYDFMNIMVYDRTGPWRPNQPGPHSTYQNAVDDLKYFKTERNIPREKIVLGVPFYGYAFSSVPELPPKSMNFGEITKTYPGSEWVDEWKLPEDYTLFYNGIPTIIQKTVLAKQEASGIMIWQLLGDAQNEKSLLRTINEVASSF